VAGFKLEGARWDINTGALEDSKPKEIFSIVPVVHAYALEVPPPGKEDKTV